MTTMVPWSGGTRLDRGNFQPIQLSKLAMRHSVGGSVPGDAAARDVRRVYAYFTLACASTWLLATPAISAWLGQEAPGQLAIACAGLSAFGPLLATLVVVPRSELRDVFGRWRAPPAWVLSSLLIPATIHLAATALFAAVAGRPEQWFHPPVKPEAVAALLVFPIARRCRSSQHDVSVYVVAGRGSYGHCVRNIAAGIASVGVQVPLPPASQ